MTRYNSTRPGDPCPVCGQSTEREIQINAVCVGCDTYVEDCRCEPMFSEAQP